MFEHSLHHLEVGTIGCATEIVYEVALGMFLSMLGKPICHKRTLPHPDSPVRTKADSLLFVMYLSIFRIEPPVQ